MPAKKKQANLPELVARYQKARTAGKRAYERSDRLMREIAAAVAPGEEIELSVTGRKAVLVDRFAAGDTIWTPCAARRWELKIIEP